MHTPSGWRYYAVGMNSQDVIQEFLSQRRIALIGLSRDAKHYSRMVYKALLQKGFDVVPVNPATEEIDDVTCYPHVYDIGEKVDAAIILTTPSLTDEALRDCAEAGVKFVWIRRESPTAVEFGNRNGIQVVTGECPLLFLSDLGFPHNFHGWIRRLTGTPLIQIPSR